MLGVRVVVGVQDGLAAGARVREVVDRIAGAAVGEAEELEGGDAVEFAVVEVVVSEVVGAVHAGDGLHVLGGDGLRVCACLAGAGM